ncbi:heme/hemin ABC transporter substrate-binding protein [Shewanella violacea]|uniref:Hemin ABC transporter, periplasmic hemin-binding protein n=1 Tax=Shewanella violacea (strain JCM 10179 / CIP 106290 / LMG 19151 / DSS12) TaxID=637905 RepID=D4ZBY8_SHEVD|nr:ABC transporter substrate-binding protein [Shewanella violacea]BAJ03533.1 hemin ABC transporter, periplasmic hemin-binding protein [Shewanella violacea DSS12]
MFKPSQILTRQVISKSLLLSASLLLTFNVSAHEDGHSHEQVQARLVSAGAGVTELVLALDAGDELVAVDSTSILPSSITKIEKLGYHRMLSAEGILALAPTLVLGTDAMGPETTLKVLKSADIKVIQLPTANDRPQLLSNIDEMGKLLDRQPQAKQLKLKLQASLDAIAAKKKQLGGIEKAPKVLFMLLQADRPARVGGEGTAADIIIKLAGGNNIANFSGYKSLSQEGILSLQPDLILISNRSHGQTETSMSHADQAASDAEKVLKAMPLLVHTPAGKNKHIQSIKPQALLGGLGISAIKAADKLASDLIDIKRY